MGLVVPRVGFGWVGSGRVMVFTKISVGPVFENIIYFGSHLVNDGGSDRVRIFLLTTGLVGSGRVFCGSGRMRKMDPCATLRNTPFRRGSNISYYYTNSNNFAFYIT